MTITLVAGLALLASCGGEPQAAQAPNAENGVPLFELDPSWRPQLPDNWVNGAAVAVMVDKQNHVWISSLPRGATDSMLALAPQPPGVPAPPIVELDPQGKVLQSWGPNDPPKNPKETRCNDYPCSTQWPASPHRLLENANGEIWIPGREEHQVIKFSRSGQRLLTIGKLGEIGGSADTTRFGGPAGIALDSETNELFVSDGYENRRLVVFDAATGAYKRHWGAYGERPDDKYQPDTLSSSPSRQFGNAHDLLLSHDGMLYLADQPNSRIQVFDRSGKFIMERIVRPGRGATTSLAFSSDPEQRFVYVGDGTQHKIFILRREGLEVIGQFGEPGKGPGQFGRPHGLAVDAAGNLYVAEARNMRWQKFLFRGYAPLPGAPSGK